MMAENIMDIKVYMTGILPQRNMETHSALHEGSLSVENCANYCINEF